MSDANLEAAYDAAVGRYHEAFDAYATAQALLDKTPAASPEWESLWSAACVAADAKIKAKAEEEAAYRLAYPNALEGAQ